MTRLTPVGVTGLLTAVGVVVATVGATDPELAGGLAVGLLACWYLLPAPVAVAVGQVVAVAVLLPTGDPRPFWAFQVALAAALFGETIADYGAVRGLAATVAALAVPAGVAYVLVVGERSPLATLGALAVVTAVASVWLSSYADRTALAVSTSTTGSGREGDREPVATPTPTRTPGPETETEVGL